MEKKIFLVFIFLFLVFTAGSVWVKHDAESAGLPTIEKEKILKLPKSSEDSNIIDLGVAIDPQSGKEVQGFAIVKYKDKGAKPVKPPRDSASSCYGFLASGTKWRTAPEPWIVNATNSSGLNVNFVLDNLTFDIAKWEDAADGTVGNSGSVDIIGSGSSVVTPLDADTVSPDGKNEVYFADITDSNAIAVTIIWGIFGGKPQARELLEWDQVYDDVDFDWSGLGEAGKMDFENIATHELGHSVGLNDLYTSACADETMYGYAANGETKKRDLNAGDIAGVSALY